MDSLRRAIASLTAGEDDSLHFELAANRIQHALLDVAVPEIDGYSFGVHAEPARLVGGDYIDLYPCGGGLLFGLGDASGKSLSAALNSLMLRYLVRGLAKALGTSDLAAIVTHTNAVITEDLSDGSFITFLLGALDVQSGSVRVVNAGHEPPLLLRNGADTVATLDLHDIVLGITHTTHYAEESFVLERGDTAVFYTDGLTEATNEQGEMYTIAGLKAEFLHNRSLPTAALATAMFEAVKRYATKPLKDDATIFIARRD